MTHLVRCGPREKETVTRLFSAVADQAYLGQIDFQRSTHHTLGGMWWPELCTLMNETDFRQNAKVTIRSEMVDIAYMQ